MEGGHLLKLIIEKGPREGETLEFQPGMKVKIGRVVRGNTLVIKDAGISSKHLSIEFISGEWILSDLDSSNGTIVNGDVIRSDYPAKLGDGDTIKIGELSSIKVSIGVPNEDAVLRRNPSRRTVKSVEQKSVGIVSTRSRRGGKLASIVDVKEPELGLGFEDKVGVSRKRHRMAVSETVEAQESLATVGTLNNGGPNKTTQTRQPSTRTTRSSKNQQRMTSSLLPPHNSTVDRTSVLEEVASVQIVEKKTQRGKPRAKKLASPTITSRNEAFAGNSSLKDSDLRKEDDQIDGNESKRQEDAVGFEEEVSAHIVDKKTQRGRGMRKKLERNNEFTGSSRLKDSHFEEEPNKALSSNNSLEASDPRKEDDAIEGNDSRLQEDAVGFEEEVSVHIVDKKTQRGRSLKKKLEGNKSFNGNSSLKDSHFAEEPNKTLYSNNSLEASDLGKVDEIDGNEPMLQDNADNFEEEEPDLEKMTLGEWFDYLQVSLTKEINVAAEEIISNMRVKAEMVEELFLQKKNESNASTSK